MSAILLVFEKIYLCFFIPSYTQNHVITYTNSVIFFFLTHVLVKLLTRVSHFSFHSDFIHSMDLRKFNFLTAVMQTGKVISLKNVNFNAYWKKKKSELKTWFSLYCRLEIQINPLQYKLNIFQKWSSLSLHSLEHISAERRLAISI